MLGGVTCCAPKRLPGTKSTLHHNPHLPVGSQPFALAVGADHDRYAEVSQFLSGAGYIDMIVMVIRGGCSPHASRFDKLFRGVPHEALVSPNLCPIVKIVFAGNAAIGDTEGRHIAR